MKPTLSSSGTVTVSPLSAPAEWVSLLATPIARMIHPPSGAGGGWIIEAAGVARSETHSAGELSGPRSASRAVELSSIRSHRDGVRMESYEL